MVHSAEDYEMAVEASQILFSNKAGETLRKIDEATLRRDGGRAPV